MGFGRISVLGIQQILGLFRGRRPVRSLRTPLTISPIGLILIPVNPLVQRNRLLNLLERFDGTK
ncbi:MAG: hypothetical protein GX455_02860 [Phycisphaerae bacterium]|nr:hypothetical protein [Phycisphaerae bacterium]